MLGTTIVTYKLVSQVLKAFLGEAFGPDSFGQIVELQRLAVS